MVRLIKTETEYEEALCRLSTLMKNDPARGTPDGDELVLLGMVIEAYEKEHVDLGMPSALEAIRFRMDQQNLRPVDLVPYLGSRSRVSEILAGKRSLSLAMIRKLHVGLGIPLTVLIQADEPVSKD